MSGAAPGWYDDGTGALRYWDGANWTEHTATHRAEHYAPPAPASGHSKGTGAWVWVLVGGLAVALVALTGGVVLLLSNHAGPVREAKAALDTYNSAWINVDCDALVAATTSAFREDWGYASCGEFEDEANAFDQAARDFTMSIAGATFDSGEVTVRTVETYTGPSGDHYEDHVVYSVVKDGDAWRIDLISYEDDDRTNV